MIKKYKKLPLYLCLICICKIAVLKAQTDFREGYIIDLKNDTLIGEIDYRGDILLGEICLFKSKKDGIITEFRPKDIQGYRFKDDRYFISKQLKGESVFLEFLIKGKINVFYLRNNSGNHYYLEKEDNKLVELPYKETIIDKNEKQYFYTSSKHIGILTYLMQDAPNFVEKINKLKEPDHDNLIELAKDYHNAVCTTESCIIYQRKKTVLKFKIEPLLGLFNYLKADKAIDKFALMGGVLAHIWLPRVNEKLYIRTGVLYANTQSDKLRNINLFKVPLQIEYIYPKGQFVPKCAYGLSFYKPSYVAVGAMVGFEAKINDKTTFNFNYDVDFDYFDYLPILPKSLLAQTISLGFFIKL